MSKEEELSKWDSSTSFEVDVEAAHPQSTIRFADPSKSHRSRRPSLSKRLSFSSIETSLSKRQIEPSVALPPIFKTVSYKIDGASIIDSKNKIDSKAETLKNKTWHVKTLDEIAGSLSSDLTKGLTTEQFNHNLKKYGPNVHSKPPSNWPKKVFIYFFGGFGALLMVGGILCCIAWKPLGNPNPAISNLILGVVLFIVFFLQAGFNFWQDFSSSRVMSSINGMLPDDVNVIRDGLKIAEHAKNLVPGDLIFISNGDRLPTDVRFVSVQGNDFAFDRSILTGESKPVYATIEAEKPGSNYLESPCLGLQGTFCVGGSGYGVVVSTGDETVFGQIAKLSSEPKNSLSPLQKEILRFVFLVVSIALSMVILVCILWGAWLRKSYPDWIPVEVLIVDLVAVLVAFIPEGLPIALTTCLIITAGVMRKHKILCKSLSVVETLGSTSVICSDKTGTLTKNKMFVTSYSVGDEEIDDSKPVVLNDGLRQMVLISKLCNAATFNPTTMNKPLNERLINGNATDQAILRFGESIDEVDPSDEWIQRGEVSFNSKNKFMVRLFESVDLESPAYNYMIKGAPDILLPKCDFYQDANGDIKDLTDEVLSRIQSTQQKWAMSGQRVVLLASKAIPKFEYTNVDFKSRLAFDKLMYFSTKGLVLNGLVGITDPPKDDIFDVVSTLKRAGIKISMVTGDFELTAIAIAKKCGILSDSVTYENILKVEDLDPNYPIPETVIPLPQRDFTKNGAISVTGDKLDHLNDNQWEQLVDYCEIVFSRTTPEQKLRIVEEFQKRGHIVGMTGDGVNDAPSLRQADIGIAMAEGSDIAKEASDLILLESFSSMVMALKFGRLVFENLKKTIAYLLPAGCYAELWAILLNIIFGFPQLLSSFCMIIISCLTDCAGAITLAYEAPEKNLLEKPPRSVTGARIADRNLILHSYLVFGTYFTFVACLMALTFFKEHGIPFNVLSLSYGIFPAEYSAEQISHLNNQASSIYFITLVIMQFFNLMAVRTRYLSVFQHKPIFDKETSNYAMFIAIAFALSVTFFFNYIKWFQDNLGTSSVPVKYFFIAMAFGCLILCYDELRKAYVRRYPKSILAKFAW